MKGKKGMRKQCSWLNSAAIISFANTGQDDRYIFNHGLVSAFIRIEQVMTSRLPSDDHRNWLWQNASRRLSYVQTDKNYAGFETDIKKDVGEKM